MSGAEELIAKHADEALPALKKIMAARGRLQGSFYFACDASSAPAGLVVTLSARDPKGQKAASQGKKLRRAIPGARFARGTVTVDDGRLLLTLFTGNATVAHLKKSIRSAFEDRALGGLRRLLRTARIATPDGAVEEPESEQSGQSGESGEGLEPVAALSAEEQAELETLVSAQGPLLEQSVTLLESFLSVGEEAAERAEIVAELSAEIAAREAAGLHGLEALTDKRRELAVALSRGDLPDGGQRLPQELRHLLTLSTEKLGASMAVFHAAAWERVRGAYEAAWRTVSGQLDALQSALRADGDPELRLIAEGGLPALLGGLPERLSAALAACDRSPERLAAVRGCAGELLACLGTPAIQAVDDNPMGVTVGLQRGLQPALAGLVEAADALSEGAG